MYPLTNWIDGKKIGKKIKKKKKKNIHVLDLENHQVIPTALVFNLLRYHLKYPPVLRQPKLVVNRG